MDFLSSLDFHISAFGQQPMLVSHHYIRLLKSIIIRTTGIYSNWPLSDSCHSQGKELGHERWPVLPHLGLSQCPSRFLSSWKIVRVSLSIAIYFWSLGRIYLHWCTSVQRGWIKCQWHGHSQPIYPIFSTGSLVNIIPNFIQMPSSPIQNGSDIYVIGKSSKFQSDVCMAEGL